MLFATHFLLGAIIGKLTGNYIPVIFGSIAIDIDHLYVFFKHKVFSLKKMLRDALKNDGIVSKHRTVIHSIFGWVIISALVYFFIDTRFGLFFSLGYLIHLFTDMMDSSVNRVFWPFKLKFRGPIRYNSKTEYIFIAILIFVLFLVLK